MSLSRADLIAAAAGELVGVLALAGMTAVDDAANLKGPIDRTYRALGFSEAQLSALIADGDEEAAIAFATYFVLARATFSVAKKFDVSGNTGAKLEQQYQHLKELRDEALRIAQGYGLQVAGHGVSGILGIPYAGGIESSDYETIAEDASRKQPLFSLNMHRPMVLEEWLNE